MKDIKIKPKKDINLYLGRKRKRNIFVRIPEKWMDEAVRERFEQVNPTIKLKDPVEGHRDRIGVYERYCLMEITIENEVFYHDGYFHRIHGNYEEYSFEDFMEKYK